MSPKEQISFINSRLYDSEGEKQLMRDLFDAVVHCNFSKYTKILDATDSPMTLVTNREAFRYKGPVSIGRHLDLFGLIGYVGDNRFINHALDMFPGLSNLHKSASRLLTGAQLNPHNGNAAAHIFERSELPVSYAIAGDFSNLIRAGHYDFISYLIAKGANPMIGDVRGSRPAILEAAEAEDHQALKILARSTHFTASMPGLESMDGYTIEKEAEKHLAPYLERNDGLRILKKFKTAFDSAYDKEKGNLKSLREMTLRLRERPGEDQTQYLISGPLYAAVAGDIEHLIRLHRKAGEAFSAKDLYQNNENDLCLMDFLRQNGGLSKMFNTSVWRHDPRAMTQLFNDLEPVDQWLARDFYDAACEAMPHTGKQLLQKVKKAHARTFSLKRRR